MSWVVSLLIFLFNNNIVISSRRLDVYVVLWVRHDVMYYLFSTAPTTCNDDDCLPYTSGRCQSVLLDRAADVIEGKLLHTTTFHSLVASYPTLLLSTL